MSAQPVSAPRPGTVDEPDGDDVAGLLAAAAIGPDQAIAALTGLRALALTGSMNPTGTNGDNDGATMTQADRLALITTLENVQTAAWAAQARLAADFAAEQRREHLAAGISSRNAGRAASDDLATARRESPFRASNDLAAARALVHEMPHTFAALVTGTIKARQAKTVTETTACLTIEDRRDVDTQLAGTLTGLGDKQILAAARAATYRADPHAYLGRGRRAAKDRYVSLRPAPDVMSMLSAYLPVASGVACHKALKEHATALKATGDSRTMGQLMADTLIERLTGINPVTGPGVEIGLIITDTTLAGEDDTPADLEGYGPIPAPTARDLIAGNTGHNNDNGDDGGDDDGRDDGEGNEGESEAEAEPSPRWIRPLTTDDATPSGRLTGRGTRRAFTGALRAFITTRDKVCTTPWCGAPIRHIDHIIPWRDGGPTTADNGRGTCARCNLHKELPRDLPPPAPLPPPPLIPGQGRRRPPPDGPPPTAPRVVPCRTTPDNVITLRVRRQ